MMLIDMIIKSTMLLSFCGILAAMLRTPAARHAVWGAGIFGMLAIAAAEGLPGWHIVPTGNAPQKIAALEGVKIRILSPTDIQIKPAQPSPKQNMSRLSIDKSAENPPTSVTKPFGGENSVPKSATANSSAYSSIAAGDIAHPHPAPMDWAGWMIRAWLAGMVLMLLPLAMAALALRRIIKTARPVQTETGLAAFKEAKALAGVHGKVMLVESERCKVPMTMGVIHPRIVVPAESVNWASERWRMVLLHELAHAKRRDIALLWMGQLARAIYWFHPPAWFAFARLGIEAEKACDDAVIQSGTDASHYAAALVDIAETSQRRPIMAQMVLHMARRSTLESRVRRVLDKHCRRKIAERHTAALVAGIALFAGALGILRAADAGNDTKAGGHEPAFFLVGDLPPGQSGTFAISGDHFRLLDALKAAAVDAKFAGDKTLVIVRNGEKDHETRQVIPYGELASDPAKNVLVLDNDMLIVERTTLPVVAADSNAVGGQFSLLGGVPMPGTYDMGGRKLTVMQALAIGRFDHDGLSTHRVDLVRTGVNGKAKIIPVHIAAILAGTEPDHYLQDKDIVNVSDQADQVRDMPQPAPASAPAPHMTTMTADHMTATFADKAGQSYYVMGAVGHPGAFTLNGSTGIFQGLAAAGAGADLKLLHVTIIQPESAGSRAKTEISLAELLTDPSKEPQVHAGDVLVVRHNMDLAREELADMEIQLQAEERHLEDYEASHKQDADAARIKSMEADVASLRKSVDEFGEQCRRWERE